MKDHTEKEYAIRFKFNPESESVGSGQYFVFGKVPHQNSPDTYFYVPITEPTSGYHVIANSSDHRWLDGNGNPGSGSFSGNERSSTIWLIEWTGDGSPDSQLGQLIQKLNGSESACKEAVILKEGDFVGSYSTSIDTDRRNMETEDGKTRYYDTVNFTVAEGGVNKTDVLNLLEEALNYGLYTGTLIGHHTDMEANIAVGVIGNNALPFNDRYGYSDRNKNVNKLTVTKEFTQDGSPLPGQQVTLKLYRWNGSQWAPATCGETPDPAAAGGGQSTEAVFMGTTDSNGKLTAVFNGLAPGKYQVREVVTAGGETKELWSEYYTVGTGADQVTATFGEEVEFKGSGDNINYFNDIPDTASLDDLKSLIRMSRHGVLVIGNRDDYNRMVDANNALDSSEQGTIVLAGDEIPGGGTAPQHNISQKLEGYRRLSNQLATSHGSETVKIYNYTYSQLQSSDKMNLLSDGKLVVVNIDMTNAGPNADVKVSTSLDHDTLSAEFNSDGKGAARRIIYNFYVRNGSQVAPYTGTINTTGTTSGTMLAPSAKVESLGANWGGTIISDTTDHKTSEIHSEYYGEDREDETTVRNNKGAEQETVSAQVKKEWAGYQGKVDLPDSLTVTLYAGDAATDHVVTLNAANSWTSAEITGLPKYDSNHHEINYHWVEGSVPAGFFLTNIAHNGILTTLTNTYQEFNLETSYVGSKTWRGTSKPESLTVTLYRTTKDPASATDDDWTKLTLEPKWLTKGPELDTWTYEFEKLPVFDAGGNVYYYRAEETLPEGYKVISTDNTSTAYTQGTAEATEVDPCNEVKITLTDSIADLGFIVIQKGHTYVIWTERIPTPVEKGLILDEARSIFKSFNNPTYYWGTKGTIHFPSGGNLTVSRSGQLLTLNFSDPSDWARFAHGHFEGSSYTAATTSWTNAKVEGTATLKAAKAVSVGGWPEGGKVTFTIDRMNDAGSANAPLPKQKTTDALTAPGEKSFGSIAFDSDDVGKTYYYEITEGTIGFGDGWTGSPEKIIAKVVVGQPNESGVLNPTVTYSIDGGETYRTTSEFYTITNTYEATADATLGGGKVIDKRDWKSTDSFEFTLTEVTDEGGKTAKAGGATRTKTVSSSTAKAGDKVAWSFDKIDYVHNATKSDVGTHWYKVTETAVNKDGLKSDTRTYVVSVDVTYNAATGTLTATPSAQATALDFVNTYEAAGEAYFFAKKAFEAAGAPRNFDKDDFSFRLIDSEGNVLQEVSNGNGAKVDQATFEPIAYTLADLEGKDSKNFVYTIKEVVPNDATNADGKTYAEVAADQGDTKAVFTKDGISYTENPTTITVTVTDKGDGTLKVEYEGGTVEGTPNGAAFTNTYAATATAQLSATKTLNDKTPKANAFEFSLTGPKIEGGSTTAKNDADGNVTFSSIIYNLEDLKKTNSDGKKCDEFNYTISEVVPEDATNADGKTYKEVVDEGGDTAAEFTKAGITYQKQTKNVKITVTDNGDGTLDVKYDGKPEFAGVAFTNTYAAKGSVQFGATKTLTGRELEAGEFEFELRNESGAKVGENKITNAADGTVTFDAIEYTLADLDNGTKKTLNYTVKEVIPEPADQLRGVTYSNAEHKVTVVLTDNGNGTISSVVTVDGDEVKPDENGIVQVGTFANTYFEATATGEFIKNYYGGAEEKTFNFQLRAANADGSDRNNGMIERKDEDGDGKIEDAGDSDSFYFDFTGTVKSTSTPIELPAKFSYAKPGTYYYIIKELPSGTDVTCDPAQILMKVEVKGTTAKDATTEVSYQVIQGGTKLDKVYEGEEHPVLYNNGNMLLGMRRTALANVNGVAQVTYFMPEVRKVMENGVLSGGEFTFELRNAEGTKIDEATNDENGNVSFKAIEYTDAGEFTYTITEVNGGAAAIKYSSIEAKLTVKVTKDADGKLTAKASYSYTDDAGKAVTCDPAKGEYPTFVNQYDTIIVKAYKGTREFDANGKAYAGEGLPGAHYGLWMVNPNGNDVYLGLGRNQADAAGAKLESNADGYLWYDLPMVEGVAYYLLEEEPAPAGHLIDPYRTDYFTLIKAGEGADVTFHLAYEGSAEFKSACPDVTPHR